MKISHNWLQNYFDEKLPEPGKLSEGIIFHAFEVEDITKVGDDTVYDIKVLPDRAHDCLSHWGIAKEVSAIFELVKPSPNSFIRAHACLLDSDGQERGGARDETSPNNFLPTTLKIQIEDQRCRRYMGRIIRNIKVGPSPKWLSDKLEAIGQRSINNVVDIANYVMFDLGNPIHAFDLDKLESEEIIVRSGKSGEKLTTLDKKDIDLDESILIIADRKDPLAIAGIKGGTKAEVDNNTKNIVIEVANFDATSTRKTAKKINIQTDAVKRYENNINPWLCALAMEEMTALIIEIAGGEMEKVIDIYPTKPEEKIIEVNVSYINHRLGTSFDKKEIMNVFDRLGFRYTNIHEKFDIKVPPLRLDLNGPEDITEEVIRIIGFDKLEGVIPKPKINKEAKMNETFSKMLLARAKLLDDGYSEVMTYVFRDEGELEVLASASDKKFLRANLSDGLKESIKQNLLNAPLLDLDEVKVFEIGTVFKESGEEMHIAYGGKKDVVEMTLDEYIKKEIPEFSSDTFVQVLGRGELESEPDHSQKYTVENSGTQIFKPWSIYPFITRDIAVWVPEGVPPEKLVDIYNDFGTELLVKEPKLFDSFTKNGRTSYAYRLVFQSYDRTLTDDEVKIIMSQIFDKIVSLGWEVR